MRLEGEKERIHLYDKAEDAVLKLSDGNPGALIVLIDLLKQPSGLLRILRLDAFGIYGQWIWIAYKDICKGNIDLLIEKLIKNGDELIKEIKETQDWKYYHSTTG